MSFLLLAIPQAFLTAAKDIAYFPVWWYTLGLMGVVRGAGLMVAGQAKGLAIGVWAANLFTPMYGQYDWEGRLISFFVRVVQIIARSIALAVWVVVAAASIIAWALIPLALLVILLLQFRPM